MDSAVSPRIPGTAGKYPFVPTLHLSGTSYEIGRQHGVQGKKQIDANVRTYTNFFLEMAEITWHEAKERAKLFMPVLEESYPEILDEMRGIAAGAGLDMLDILVLNVRSEIALTNYEDEGTPTPVIAPPAITDGCTSFGQISADGETLVVAQNWDWIEELHDGMVVLDIMTADGVRMQFLNEAGLVGKIGISSHGFSVCMNAIRSGSKRFDRFPSHIMLRRMLEFATSVDEALRLLDEFGGACAVNFMMGDVSGDLVNAEVTPHGTALFKPLSSSPLDDARDTSRGVRGNGRQFVAHSNHLVSVPSSFSGGPVYDHPSNNSFSRLERMGELCDDAIAKAEPLTLDAAFKRFQDEQGAPCGICRDRPPGAKGMERMLTLATIVTIFHTASAKFEALLTIGRPCEAGLQTMKLGFFA